MSNILFKRGSQSALNTLKNGSQGIDGAFYLTEDTHRLYAGIGNKIVDLNKYITVVNAESDLNTINPQVGDFAYITAGNILAVYTTGPVTENGVITQRTKWFQINVNTDTTYTIKATGDAKSDPGLLTLGLYDQKDALASSEKIKFIGTKGVDVTISNETLEDNSTRAVVTIEGNPYSLDVGYTENADKEVTAMTVTLNSEDEEVTDTTFNITAGANITFDKTTKGISINGVDAADFDKSSTLKVDGGNATLALGLKNGNSISITAENANDKNKNPFYLTYGRDGLKSVDNQGFMDVLSREEVINEFAKANAMVYKGTITSVDGFSATASIGDTYMAASAISFYLGGANTVSTTIQENFVEQTAKIGDLFIATSSDGTEKADGTIDSTKLVWTYIPSGDDSQTDTTYSCSLNINTNTFSIVDSRDTVIGHIKVAGDDIISVTSARGTDSGVVTPWNLTLEHAEEDIATPTDGEDDALSVVGISAIDTDGYGHISSITTKTTNLRTYKLTGASASVANNSATFTHTLSDSKDQNVTTATMRIATTANDNLTVTANGNNGITIGMVWGTFE